MNVQEEIATIRATIRQVEDPAVATALRHVCNVLEARAEEAPPVPLVAGS